MDLLPDRLAKVVGFRGGEAGDLLRDVHGLLLVDRDPVGLARDLLQPSVRIGHGLLAGLAARVDRDVLHRPRAVERDERDQVLEDRRLDLPQRVAHARALELEDAGRLAARQHRVRLLVVEGDRADVQVVDERARLVDHVEVPKAEEVHLQQAERLDRVHRELRDDLLVGALLLERHDVHQRLGSDHDACGVDRVLAREALERPGEVDDLARHRIGVVRLLQLGPGLEAVLEVLARPFRDQLRDLVDDAVGDFQHAAGVADGCARGHGPKGDDLRDAVAAVFLGDIVDDALAAVDGEVDVDVGHRLAARVEKALEEQVVADRVDVGDLEAVRDERARGRAAARTDADAVPLREADEVGDDQEVIREAHLADRLQLELEPFAQLGRDLVVAPLEPLLAELHEVVEGIPSVGCREVRQQDTPELDLDVAALGDLERAAQGVLPAREVAEHLRLRLEVEVVGVELPVVRVLERVARLDAEERLVRARVLVPEVMHVTRRDGRYAALRRELLEQRIDALLDVEVRVLQLDVDVVLAEDRGEPVELAFRVVGAALLERLADATREASRERDQPRAVRVEQLPVDPRLVVVALEVAEARELDQVRVAGVVAREQGQVGVTLLLGVPVVGDVDLAADDRLDALALGGFDEVDRARERSVVGERHCRHLELRGPLRQRRNPAGPVENRVLRVDVEVDERDGLGHGEAIVLGGPDGAPRTRESPLRGPLEASTPCPRLVAVVVLVLRVREERGAHVDEAADAIVAALLHHEGLCGLAGERSERARTCDRSAAEEGAHHERTARLRESALPARDGHGGVVRGCRAGERERSGARRTRDRAVLAGVRRRRRQGGAQAERERARAELVADGGAGRGRARRGERRAGTGELRKAAEAEMCRGRRRHGKCTRGE